MWSFQKNFLDSFLTDQKDRLILWAPVFMGVGIATYFSLESFSRFSVFFSVGTGLFSTAAMILFSKFFKLRLFFMGLFCIALGFMATHFRTWRCKTPMLVHSIKDPVWVKGTIDDITQGTNQKKIILSVKRIQTVTKNPPKKIQLIYRSKKQKEKTLQIGDFVNLKAKLEPLQGPIVPNGYDFRKQAFFKQIGAQGYVVYVHEVTPPHQNTFFHQVQNYRLWLTQHFLKHLPGQPGAIAAALITGDTGSLSKETRTVFADSGTAHILAISGLHLSLIGGLILAITRFLVGFCPPLILRIPAKKIAAVLALLGALGYLYLSGCRVPTQRAFISFSIMMIAILIDRNPLSMRLVSFAATLILLISPEVLFTPSFQLSFAAVVGLISFYETIQIQTQRKSTLKKMLFYTLGILLSSVVASVATLPFTIYHFYKFTLQSIGSNLVMIPLLGLWIMPLALCFVFLGWWPWGQKICAILLGKGLSAMTLVADFFSKLPGSLIHIPSFSTTSFILTLFGGLCLCLLKGKIRWSGLVLISAAALYTFFCPKPIPTIFIAEGGKNIGIVHKDHLFISSPRTDSFVATVWAGYAGIRPDHVIKLKQKNPHPLMPTVAYHGKNVLITLNGTTIGYMKTEEDLPLFYEKSDILIAPKVRGTDPKYGGSPKFLLESNNLNQKSWVYYKESGQVKPVISD